MNGREQQGGQRPDIAKARQAVEDFGLTMEKVLEMVAIVEPRALEVLILLNDHLEQHEQPAQPEPPPPPPPQPEQQGRGRGRRPNV